MIIRTSHAGVDFSPIVYPEGGNDLSISIASEGDKQGKIINMKLTAICLQHDSGKSQLVLEAISNYSILTDGSISVNELYTVYEHAMLLVIDRLHAEEKAKGVPATELPPLKIQDLSEELVALSQIFSH